MKTIRIRVFFSIMFFALSVFTQQALAEEASSATQALKTKIDAILDVLKAPEFRGEENKEIRRQKIRGIVVHSFDFGRMAQSSLGKHWRDRTPEEKQDFTVRFQRLIENTYIAKLEAYTNEKVVYLNEQRITRKNWEYANVQTQVITTDDTPINIDYIMYRQGGADHWLVSDINIEGVSMNNKYRDENYSFLKKNSFLELLKFLDTKNSSS